MSTTNPARANSPRLCAAAEPGSLTRVSRRAFLASSGAGAVALAGVGTTRAHGQGSPRPVAAASLTPPPELVLKVERVNLAPDGVSVPAVVVNGGIPGPEIRLRRGGLFRVLVENHLSDAPTSIHWHGMLVPCGMDGVPGITTLAIPPNRTFLYEFPLRQTGTYWYHSHEGFQEQQGLFGALIVEDPDEATLADRDAVVLLSDWVHRDPNDVFAALRQGARAGDGGSKVGESSAQRPMDMEGTGRPGGMSGMQGADLSDVKYDAFLLNGRAAASPWTLEARPGERVRLRVINGGASTLFKVALDDHPLVVTHADGQAVEPVEVDWVLMGMGETYDLLVTLKAPGAYTLHALAQDGSGQALGVLHSPGVDPRPNRAMPTLGPRQLGYSQLRAPDSTRLPEGPARGYRLPLRGDMATYSWSVGDTPFPAAAPLLVRQGERVRLDIVNETGMWHPMHLHGHFFRLLNDQGGRAPLKHTVNVGPGESVAVEFLADNPGTWFFHCHNLYHLEAGMARLFEYEVGD